MSQETTHIPKLRFPEFEDDWATERLGDFYIFKNGVNAEKEAYGSGIKFVNVMDIVSDSPLRYDKIIGEVEISESEFKKNEVIYGDILFQRSSETREEVGQSNVYIDKTQKATFGGFVIRGRATQKQKPLFMHYLLKTQKVRKDMTARSGGSTRYNVGQESLSKVIIKTTNDECEQQKIASFLTVTDKKIELLQRKKDQLTAYKKGMMQKLFSQEIRFKDDDGKDFPEWEERKLGELGSFTGGGTPDSNNIEYWAGNKPWVSSSDLTENNIQTLSITRFITALAVKESAAKKVPAGSLLIISRVGVGKVAVSTEEIYTSQDFCSFTPKINVNLFYLGYWMLQNKKELLRLSQGTSIKGLTSSELKILKVEIPHPDEQQKIANYLTALDKKIELTDKKLTQAQTFKKGLLQQMFI